VADARGEAADRGTRVLRPPCSDSARPVQGRTATTHLPDGDTSNRIGFVSLVLNKSGAQDQRRTGITSPVRIGSQISLLSHACQCHGDGEKDPIVPFANQHARTLRSRRKNWASPSPAKTQGVSGVENRPGGLELEQPVHLSGGHGADCGSSLIVELFKPPSRLRVGGVEPCRKSVGRRDRRTGRR